MLSNERDYVTSQVSVEEPLEKQASRLQQISTTSISAYGQINTLDNPKGSVALTTKSERRPLDIFEKSTHNFAKQLFVTEEDNMNVSRENDSKIQTFDYDTANNSVEIVTGPNIDKTSSGEMALPKEAAAEIPASRRLNSGLMTIDDGKSLQSLEFNTSVEHATGSIATKLETSKQRKRDRSLAVKDSYVSSTNSKGTGNVTVLPALNIMGRKATGPTVPTTKLVPISQQIEKRREAARQGSQKLAKEIKFNFQKLESDYKGSRSVSPAERPEHHNVNRAMKNILDSKEMQFTHHKSR